MSIITISRGSYSRGKEAAEKVAEELGYECISRDILLEASDRFHVPEVKLVRAIHDSPSILGRFSQGKERYVAFIREALLRHVQKDNVVYHGLAGHFFLQQIPHVLKVRIISDFEDRVREEMKRENIPEEEARYTLKKDDEERRKWGLSLYGADTWDSSLYDVVLHVRTMKVRDVVNVLLHTVKLPCFQTTKESQRVLDDLLLASRMQLSLVLQFRDVNVTVKDGVAFVSVRANLAEKKKVTARIKEASKKLGIKETKVNVIPLSTVDSLDTYKFLRFD